MISHGETEALGRNITWLSLLNLLETVSKRMETHSLKLGEYVWHMNLQSRLQQSELKTNPVIPKQPGTWVTKAGAAVPS